MNQFQNLSRRKTKLFDWDNLSLHTQKEKQNGAVENSQSWKFKNKVPVELGFQL